MVTVVVSTCSSVTVTSVPRGVDQVVLTADNRSVVLPSSMSLCHVVGAKVAALSDVGGIVTCIGVVISCVSGCEVGLVE